MYVRSARSTSSQMRNVWYLAAGCGCSEICTSCMKNKSRCPCDCSENISGASHPKSVADIPPRWIEGELICVEAVDEPFTGAT